MPPEAWKREAPVEVLRLGLCGSSQEKLVQASPADRADAVVPIHERHPFRLSAQIVRVLCGTLTTIRHEPPHEDHHKSFLRSGSPFKASRGAPCQTNILQHSPVWSHWLSDFILHIPEGDKARSELNVQTTKGELCLQFSLAIMGTALPAFSPGRRMSMRANRLHELFLMISPGYFVPMMGGREIALCKHHDLVVLSECYTGE